jgi:hypothetical protein
MSEMTDMSTSTRQFRVTIEYDQDCESPNEYGIGRIVSFNDRHKGFEDPYTVLACQWEGEDEDGYAIGCEQGPHGLDDADIYEVPAHEYVRDPDVLAILSYGEHGQSRWWVADGGTGSFGPWDSVRTAGAIVWQGEDSERAWWADLSEPEKADILNTICEVYTDWSNGACYYYAIEVRSGPSECASCGSELDDWDHVDSELDDWDHVDSCGGFIGDDYMVEAIANELVDLTDSEIESIEFTGDASWIFDYANLGAKVRAAKDAREARKVSE